MLLILGVLFGLGASLLSGGRLGAAMDLRLRWPLLPVGALLVKEITLLTPVAGLDLAPIAYAISLFVLAAWTLWHIERLPGAWLLAAGTLLNLLPVLANGGHMPVAPELAGRGLPALGEQGHLGQYVLMGAQTNLNFLGDWVALPQPVAAVLPEAYSPGDLVAAAGLVGVGFLATRRRPVAQTAGRIVSDRP